MNQTYVVKAGDTLYGISNQFGVSVTELASLNNVDAKSLQIGQVLKIPTSSGVNPDNMFLYTVKRGDTLYSIAKIYKTTVSAIKSLNYLTSDNLVIGQVIRIPEVYTSPSDMVLPEFVNYKVQKGDTLYSIAKKYNVDVNTIMQDNSLINSNLTIGQNLKIRLMKGSGEVLECFGEGFDSNVGSSVDYVVKKGDSLYSIAKKFQTTVDNIKKKNNLTSNNLGIGQILKI